MYSSSRLEFEFKPSLHGWSGVFIQALEASVTPGERQHVSQLSWTDGWPDYGDSEELEDGLDWVLAEEHVSSAGQNALTSG